MSALVDIQLAPGPQVVPTSLGSLGWGAKYPKRERGEIALVSLEDRLMQPQKARVKRIYLNLLKYIKTAMKYQLAR